MASVISVSQVALRSWRGDTFTARRSGWPSSACIWTTAEHAERSTQPPSLMIMPPSSATGMKRSGVTGPSTGLVQRTSASTPTMAPDTRSSWGWKTSPSSSWSSAWRSAAESDSLSLLSSSMPCSNHRTPLRPAAFAWYIAMSACLRSAAGSSPSAG